ncbi:SusC/RagA family TonB-linked outer membrane protein [uncultured Alistipes sp.]|uniref:SusC/RagA family TonB-linked outer membrane protein n=1 Tax=uncultured Alistipes sp. TaxID=538949 RepID=UPI00262D90DB|nr:SusC/RagA family TonB-linked outer membrane protein [uncultured Alistipes sp.]
MNEIKKQTRYLFINQDVKGLDNLKVSINVVDELISKVLDGIFTPHGIAYYIDGKSIIISNRPKAESTPVRVQGRVTDASGQPVIGASVIVRGTTLGVSTDAEGRFALEVPAPAASRYLEISYLGYETASIPVGSRTSFSVTLQESSSEIEQVVVTALGIKREEKALSYNVQQIGAEEITTVKDANFMNSLAGKVAGVTINASSSGVGGATKVVLRGNKSISQSSNALYVIDGIPMYNFGGGGGTEFDSKGATESIADINPEDIESISVLTGAAAAALYGSNAANGAVMITTKKGEAGALKVTLSSNTEFLNPFVLPEFQNRYGTGLNGSASGSSVYSWGQKLTPAARTGYTPEDFLETGHVYTNAVTVSGGTDRNQTYFSAASVNSDGIIPNNEYDRYNFTFRNTSYFLKDKLRLDASASYIYQQDQNMTNQGVYSNPLVPAYLFPRGTDFDAYRIFERYNPASKLMEQFWSSDLEGGDLRMQNPYWIAYRNLRNTDKKRYMLSFSASYDILPWLNVAGRVRIDNANSLYTQKLYASSNTTITDGGKNGHYTEQREYDTQTYADVMVNINKTFGDDWSLQANVGASINNVKTDLLSYRGPIQENGLPNVFNVFDLDDSKKRAEKSGWQEQTQSIFASVEVGWKQMLYLTVTGRNDWASQLAESPESSFFYPSVGLSWVPTSLWDMGEAVTYLKLRGSIASVGMPFPRHLTIPTYEYDATNKVWTAKTHYPIGDLYPERTRTYELGLDARLWRHISLSASWYWADTYNQTFDPQISVSSGYSTIYLQTGHVRNTGVELSAGYDNTWRDFRWATNFTFSWNKNEIVELVHNYTHPETGELITKERLEIKGLGKAKYILKPGGTLGDLYTNSDLVYNKEGFIEVDKSGNVAVKDDYMEDIYLGSVFPKYNLAWRNDFSWKGVNLGVLFTARIGGICYSATQANMDLYGVSEASAAARDAGGVLINGRQTIDAQKWYQAIGSQSGLPQYYTYSATNFRLQELSLGYTLPAKWFRDRMRMTVSFVGRNLWMIYCKAPFDPEAVASTGLNYQGIDYFMMPSLRSLGFNVKFQF